MTSPRRDVVRPLRWAPALALIPLLLAPTTSTATTTTVTQASVRTAGTTVGTTGWAVPSGAIIVAPNGSDTATGTATAPLRTLAKAIAKASSGATIALRAGTYHESVVIPAQKRLTIQSWPKEAVWLDGAETVTGWVSDGTMWRRDNWTLEFDHSPTMTRNAPDNTAAHWTFLSRDYPMAAHPDQIWINGVALKQAATKAEVTAGWFFHDEVNNDLYVGSTPVGKTVSVSTLQRAIFIQSDSTVVRGIGVRRFAPSVPDLGAITIESSNVKIVHVAITDISTRGLSINNSGAIVRNVHVARTGMLGIGGSRADGLVLDKVLVEDNNTERFNTAPVAGGAKFTRLRGITVRNSIFRDNYGNGLWLDETTYNSVIVGNDIRDNYGHGVSLELSAKSIFANNIVTNNSRWGLKINNTSDTQVWNNTFRGNGGSIWLVQDSRVPKAGDSRWPFPELAGIVTWQIGPATFANNVLANQLPVQPTVLSVVDPTRKRTAAQIGVTANGNIYNRTSASAPLRLHAWAGAAAGPIYYKTLADFRAATGQEAAGRQIDGTAVVDAQGVPTSAMPAHSTAKPLPTSIAPAVGQPAGTRHFGAWDADLRG